MRHHWEALGLPDDGLFEQLVARYAEPHRRYHTVDHLAAVVRDVDRLGGGDAARLAAWFHDAVYDPRAANNEEQSARLAEEELGRRGVDPALVERVAALVRATAGHGPPDGPDAAVLFDADLAILAAPPADYDAYAAAIREEYAFVPDDAFRAGRARVLRSLLDAGPLFTIDAMRPLEAAARANVERELAALDGDD